MDQFTPQPDLSLQLPRDMYYQVIHTLCGSLPPPVSATPEDRARRDNAAIAQVACLLPANADEANLAAQYVAASAQALDSLRQARENPSDAARALQCIAQSACMMRQARGARSLLIRVQAVRQKREADNASCDRAAWLEHCTIGLMADALGRTAPAPMSEPPPPQPAPITAEEAWPQPDPVAEADHYAITYPRRAALIRSLGCLPAPCTFGPPEPELVQAIVTGTSPILRALDSPAEARAAAG
jgi:hypothetical protein